jgi:acetyl-CoA C-acetyltransferase
LNQVYVTGVSMTRFGKRQDKSIVDLAMEAGLGALNDAGQKDLKVDAVYVGSAASGQFCGIENLGDGCYNGDLQMNWCSDKASEGR